MISQAMDATSDPALASAILAAGGVTVMVTNDAPYLFNGRESLQVFAAPGILDSSNTTARLESGALPGAFTSPQDMRVEDGDVLNLDELSRQLPVEDAIQIPGKIPSLHFSVLIDGKKREIAIPTTAISPPAADLARTATATASSCEDGYRASGAIDGVADGYPTDKRYEWSSNHEKAGAWLKLAWSEDQQVSRVVLFDRPNLVDQVLGGRIVLSDGSAIPFGALPNDGKIPVNLKFPTRQIRWLRVEITAVSATTQNAGLAEIGAFQ
jgi:hypothetical protein